jgi:hypothetical protein
MFDKLKRRTAKGAVIGVVAASLAGGMALQEAAPANAIFPIIGLAVMAGGGTATATTVSAAGVGAIAGFGAIIGGALWASDPDRMATAVEWLKEPIEWDEPENWFKRKKDPVTNERVDEVKKQKPDTTVINPSGSSSPSQSGYEWKSKHILNTSSTRSARTSTDPERVWFQFEHDQSKLLPQYHYFNVTQHVTKECQDISTGARYTLAGPQSGVTIYRQDGFGEPKPAKSGWMAIDCVRNETPRERAKILSVTLRPVTTAEKFSLCGSTCRDDSRHASYDGTLSWLSKDIPEPTKPGYLTTVECASKTAGAPNVKISQQTPAGGKQVSVPSCAAAGLGNPKGMVVDWADGDKILAPKPLFTTATDPMLDCDVALGKQCRMEVWIDGAPCVMGETACQSWAGLYTAAPGRVECRYGGKVVDISGCAILEGAYIHGGTPAIAANVDGNPMTWEDPASYPDWKPHAVTEVGPKPDEEWKVGAVQVAPNPTPAPDIVKTPEPKPEPPKSPEPSASPSPSTQPSSEPSPSATASVPLPPKVEPPGNPSGEPGTNSENCIKGAVSWNPVDWVLVPTKCALQWAFVPKQPVKARVEGMTAQFSGKAPVSWFGVGGEPISGGSCPTSWAVEFRGESYSLICGTAADGIIRAFRPVLGAMLIIAAMWPLIRSLFYSSIPILKVTPS